MKKPQPAKAGAELEIQNKGSKTKEDPLGVITFEIHNPDSKPEAGQPVIYYDRPKASSLDFTISQTPDLGIPQIVPGDKIDIKIPGNLLQSLSKENMPAKGWKATIEELTDDNQYKYQITLTPTAEIKFGTEEVTIRFPQLQGTSVTNNNIWLEVTAGGDVAPKKNKTATLTVQAYPDQSKNLTDVLTFSSRYNSDHADLGFNENFFVSRADLQPPIANQLTLNLAYSGKGPLIEEWNKGNTPLFNFSFVYGYGANALTDDLQAGDGDPGAPVYNPLTSAYNIEAGLDDNQDWDLPNATNTTSWQVKPLPNNKHLFTSDNNTLSITFRHLISRLPLGTTILYIQWGNIPGYNDGVSSITIEKTTPIPKITSFSPLHIGQEPTLAYKQGVQLKWETFAAARVLLTCEENPALNKIFETPIASVADANPQFIYCGGVRTTPLNTKQPCGSMRNNQKDFIIPIDPVNTFHLLPVDKDGNPLKVEIREGDTVRTIEAERAGPVTVRIVNYPAPELEQEPSVTSAVKFYETEEKGTPVFYIRPYDQKISLGWKLKDTNVLKSIKINGPKTHLSIEDPKGLQQAGTNFPYRLDGTYTLRFTGRDDNWIERSIIVRKLFSFPKVFKSSDISATAPFYAALSGHFSIVGGFRNVYKVTLDQYAYNRLAITYHLEVRLEQGQVGTISCHPEKNNLSTLSPTDRDSPLDEPLYISFPPTSVPLLVYNVPITWEIAADGTIQLKAKETLTPLNPTSLVPVEGSTAETLNYALHAVPSQDNWFLDVLDPDLRGQKIVQGLLSIGPPGNGPLKEIKIVMEYAIGLSLTISMNGQIIK